MEQHTSRRDWLLAASIIAGSAVRLYQLSEQIIADDEWHALHAARDRGFASIAGHFGGADFSIPMALFYKAAMMTVGLSEWIMRAPVLLFGLLTLVAFPLLVGKLFDRPRAALFGWLLAISPLHIYYSRYARPYSIALFCALSGVLAFYLWRTTAARRWRYVYAVCAIVGPYFHLSVLLVVGVPIALMVLSALFKQSRAREFPNRELVQVVVFVGIGLAVLLLPPIYGDFATLADKARHGTLTREALVGAIGLLLGIESHSVQAFSLAIIAVGALSVWRRRPQVALLLGTSAAVVILTIFIARPAGIEYPIVMARYALFLLPVVLLLLADGLYTIGAWLTRDRPAGAILGMAWIVVLLEAGPLREIYYRPSNFTNHGAFQYYPSLKPQANPYIHDLSRPVSAFYVELGRQPAASMRILEAPWYYEWAFNPYPFYQHVHRQWVKIGFVKSEAQSSGELRAFDARFRFRNFVHLRDMNGLCAHKIDRVVIHKNLQAELGRPIDRDFSAELPGLITLYEQTYGAPIFEDATLMVFSTTEHCRAAR